MVGVRVRVRVRIRVRVRVRARVRIRVRVRVRGEVSRVVLAGVCVRTRQLAFVLTLNAPVVTLIMIDHDPFFRRLAVLEIQLQQKTEKYNAVASSLDAQDSHALALALAPALALALA